MKDGNLIGDCYPFLSETDDGEGKQDINDQGDETADQSDEETSTVRVVHHDLCKASCSGID